MTAKFFMNGGVNNNWSADTNWSTTASSGPNNTTHAVAGDAVTVNAGSPACTVDTASACTSINFTGYTGTFTYNGNMTVTGSVTYSATMTVAGTSDLIVNGVATLTSGGITHTGGLQLNGASSTTITMSGTWTVNGALQTNTSGLNVIIAGAVTINVAGGLTINANGGSGASVASTIVMTGGTWNSSTGVLTTGGSGQVKFQGNVTVGGNARLSTSFKIVYVSGTITTSASTLICSASCTLDTSGMSWTAITISASITLTLLSALVFTGNMVTAIGSTLTMSGSFSVSGGSLSTGASGTNVYVFASDWTLSGNLTLNAASITFSANFNLTAATASLAGPAGSNVINVNGHDITITGVMTVNNTAGGTEAINTNSGKVLNIGGATTTTSVTGTCKLVMIGGATWTGAAGSIANNMDFNGGVVTLSGTCLYITGTLTYVAGSFSGSGTLSFASGTYNLAVSIGTNNITVTGACTCSGAVTCTTFTINTAGTVTLNAVLTATTTTLPNTAATFGGTSGFVTGTLNTATLTASRIYTFASTVEYIITTAFNVNAGVTSAIRAAFKASTPGSKALITLRPGATQDVAFADPTDIDSNGGRTIVDYKGTITTTFNWTSTIPPIRVQYQPEIG